MVYDTLIAMDGDLNPQPQMLEGWDVSDDGLTYTFTLRDGLKWHDGAPVHRLTASPASCVGASATGWVRNSRTLQSPCHALTTRASSCVE
ncbi:MAG: hypothetical protein CM1200mP41_02010 [Gammaproteobacteria bacterium]|nr:MAG: hypothetical protein CM1200mP41_02010 [Gammaproteobacteria bacterium]